MAEEASQGGAPVLKRALTLPLLTLYGLGTTIGAGIYVLVGEVAGVSGLKAPLAFLGAAVLAGLTALSFGEMAARFPRSAGEAVYVFEGFGVARLSLAVGLMVVLAGTISSAAIINGFAGYFRELLTLPVPLLLTAIAVALGAVAAWGIAESVTIAAIFTAIEIGGLVIVIIGGAPALGALPDRLPEIFWPGTGAAWLAVGSGIGLAFYAFIGFEDMVNVAEETRDPARTMPAAITATLVITAVLYVAIALVAVLAVPVSDLAASAAPLALLFARTTGADPTPITLVALVAVMNGALIQIIMASRILYGLASQGWLPRSLARVNPHTRTPLTATAIVTLCVLFVALALPLVTLARATSLVTLVIFALVNLALLRVKARAPRPAGVRPVPALIPALGFVASTAFAAFQALDLFT